MGRIEGEILKWTYVERMNNLLYSIWQEKNSTAKCSPLINPIKSPVLSSNGVSVNGSVGDSVDSGSYRYVLVALCTYRTTRALVRIDYQFAIECSCTLSSYRKPDCGR